MEIHRTNHISSTRGQGDWIITKQRSWGTGIVPATSSTENQTTKKLSLRSENLGQDSLWIIHCASVSEQALPQFVAKSLAQKTKLASDGLQHGKVH